MIDVSEVTIIREGVCLKTDRELIWQALMAKARSLERVLMKGNLSPNERKMLQDEYERYFSLTEQYSKSK